MTGRVRALVVTPDFPPAYGGIQLVVDRVVRHSTGIESRVVTLDGPGARDFDAGQSWVTRRVGKGGAGRRWAVTRLNAAAIGEASAFTPEVVLSAHIVTSPACWVIRRQRKVPLVQYLYADELVHRPRLARFATAQAHATIVISEYTRELALRLSAAADRLHLIPPGIDLPPAPRVHRAARPTLVTVGRLEDRFKGHDVMLRALPLIRERVPDTEWVVIIDGR